VYLPLNYNSISSFNAGVGLKAGPLYIGSGSIINTLVSDSKQADFYIGLHVGILHKHKKIKQQKIEEVITPAPVEAAPKIPDTDNDGINDPDDKCPTVPGLAKYEGCPIPDTDGDGINDEADKCPTVPGLAKYEGCPIPDTDGDGINDEADKCPTVPGLEKYEGCPIPDTDGDSINDEEDKCPTVFGVIENSGCPEIKKEIIKKVNYAASHLLFATGKSKILPASYTSMNLLAAILETDKTLQLRIDGHTDNVGKPDKNQLLSEARANAAKTYLIKKGIAAERITTNGYGDTKPVADNKIKAGKSKNRRIEMQVSN
jgi:OOP family OmpA-OmpF porin